MLTEKCFAHILKLVGKALYQVKKRRDKMDLKNIDKLNMLNKPMKKIIDVVLDTDTFNEIDDQYALAYLLNSDEKLNTIAIHAAPFFNHKVRSPEEGMLKSYQEILKVLDLMDRNELQSIVYKGSNRTLSNESDSVPSEAVDNLIKLSQAYSKENPLYVVAVAGLTNIASALLKDPTLVNRMVLVWLGGHSYDWSVDPSFDLWEGYPNEEFNLMQDIYAAKVVFNSNVMMVHVPCMGVVSGFTTTGPELEYWLKGKNKLCDYLVEVTEKEAVVDNEGDTWSREIWDVAAVAWLLDGNFMWDRYTMKPAIQNDGAYSHDQNGDLIKYVYYIDRDNLFSDLFRKLAR